MRVKFEGGPNHGVTRDIVKLHPRLYFPVINREEERFLIEGRARAFAPRSAEYIARLNNRTGAIYYEFVGER